MLKKKEIDYNKPEMLSKFTSQNGRILSLKYTNIST
jgi:ribosomal protein S18